VFWGGRRVEDLRGCMGERKRRVMSSMSYGIGNAGLDWGCACTYSTRVIAQTSAPVQYLGSIVGRLERGHIRQDTRISTTMRRQQNAMGLDNAAHRRAVAAYVRAEYPAKSHARARESPDSHTENL
jgi:hypothetical protein